MNAIRRAYLDIETTGFSHLHCEITVIGICLERGSQVDTIQLYERDLTRRNLLTALGSADVLHTFNGSRFDLPFIKAHLDVDLGRRLEHDDLMFHCRKRNWKGGQKEIERRLRIKRDTEGVDGYMAVVLWRRYQQAGCIRSLRTLLQYNAEDVRNLVVLRRRLGL